MLSEREITDYYQKPSDKMVYPLKFVPHDGYYPLISLPVLYKGEYNPYFSNIHIRRIDGRLGKLNLLSAGIPFIYKKSRSIGGPFINFYSGFYSAIASPDNFEYMPSNIFTDDRKYRMKGEIDIFCLGVVSIKNLPNFTVMKERHYSQRKAMRITLDLTQVKILVNEEKLRKTLFTKTNYTATIRSNILRQIKTADDESKITVEDVSDEYLNSFTVGPKAVRTNSLVEAMQIGNEVKDSVFSNLKEVLV
jgi:hypothetical protein